MRSDDARVPMPRYLAVHLVGVPLVLVAIAWGMHTSGFDQRFEDVFFDPGAGMFPWRRNELLEMIGHQLVKAVPIGTLLLALGAAIFASFNARLRAWRAILWCVVAALAIGPTLITQLKAITAPPCPWDLQRYGGWAPEATRWFAPSRADAGRCFPSGHAGAGFAMLALYFAGMAANDARLRWGGLALGMVCGVAFGMVRMVQGAHFPSHVVASAGVDWVVSALVFLPLVACWKTNERAVVAGGEHGQQARL